MLVVLIDDKLPCIVRIAFQLVFERVHHVLVNIYMAIGERIGHLTNEPHDLIKTYEYFFPDILVDGQTINKVHLHCCLVVDEPGLIHPHDSRMSSVSDSHQKPAFIEKGNEGWRVFIFNAHVQFFERTDIAQPPMSHFPDAGESTLAQKTQFLIFIVVGAHG